MYFKGWIPTVTGHLSFTNVGETDHPTRSRCYGSAEKFCVSQRRDLLDVAFIDFGTGLSNFIREIYARITLRITGRLKFFLLAEWDEARNVIHGNVFVLPEYHLKSELHRIEVKLSNYFKRGTIESIRYSDLCDYLSEHSFSSANICVKRNGQAEIRTNVEPGDAFGRDMDEALANQIFYFLKDCFHKHQHHEPSHDAIITCERVQTDVDESWISKTQHTLYRQIIRYKRYSDEKSLFRASGVLAYAEAFEQNFKDSGAVQPFRTVELEKSLSVRREELRHFNQIRFGRHQFFSAVFFSTAAFLLSVVSIARLDKDFSVEAAPFLLTLTEVIAKYPAAPVSIVFIFSKLIQIRTYKVRPAEWTIIRSLYQITRGYPLAVFLGCLTIFSLVLIIFAKEILTFAVMP